MTTGVVCGGSIKTKPPPPPRRLLFSAAGSDSSPAQCRIMDPQFMQLESQLAALRNQRHPMMMSPPTAKFTGGGGGGDDASPTPTARVPSSPVLSPKHEAIHPRRPDAPNTPASLALSQDPAVTLHTELSSSSSSSSSPSSSSCSVESDKRYATKDVRASDSQQVS